MSFVKIRMPFHHSQWFKLLPESHSGDCTSFVNWRINFPSQVRVLFPALSNKPPSYSGILHRIGNAET